MQFIINLYFSTFTKDNSFFNCVIIHLIKTSIGISYCRLVTLVISWYTITRRAITEMRTIALPVFFHGLHGFYLFISHKIGEITYKQSAKSVQKIVS